MEPKRPWYSYIDETFLHFTLGFALILGVAFVVLNVVGYLGQQ